MTLTASEAHGYGIAAKGRQVILMRRLEIMAGQLKERSLSWKALFLIAKNGRPAQKTRALFDFKLDAHGLLFFESPR